MGECLTLWTHRRAGKTASPCRLGVVVRRRDGSASSRNLFKRRVREVFRTHKSRWRNGWDVIVSPRDKPVGSFPPAYAVVLNDILGLTVHMQK